MSGIVWLASYPKSGNTWFRVFLENLRFSGNHPIDINNMCGTRLASNRYLFDELLGVESSDLLDDEILTLRREMYLTSARMEKYTQYYKIHDAFTYTKEGLQVIPASVTEGVIYLIRNPLDVVNSYASFLSCGNDEVIDLMADKEFALAGDTRCLKNQLRAKVSSWSNHVSSWVNDSKLNVHVVRFEDMVKHPYATFRSAVGYLGLQDYKDNMIKKAIKFSEFKELARQEKENRFTESSPNNNPFFRKGEIGGWRGSLSENQIERIINDHREVMMQFGYLSEYGKTIM